MKLTHGGQEIEEMERLSEYMESDDDKNDVNNIVE